MDGEGESDGKAGTGNGNGTWPGKEKERELPPLPRRDGIVSRPSEESVQHADGNAWGSSRLMGKGAERDLSSEKEERSTLDAAKAALGMQTSAEPTPHSSSTTSSGEKAAPSSPASGETHPLADQVSLIIYFMAGTVLAALVLAKIHWMLSIVVAGAATHVLWKKLGCAIKDEEWERQMDRIAAVSMRIRL